ncbi:hypothetical protein N9L68_06265 [bacterium]|nr:hypothetical protein [bacterium]
MSWVGGEGERAVVLVGVSITIPSEPGVVGARSRPPADDESSGLGALVALPSSRIVAMSALVGHARWLLRKGLRRIRVKVAEEKVK